MNMCGPTPCHVKGGHYTEKGRPCSALEHLPQGRLCLLFHLTSGTSCDCSFEELTPGKLTLQPHCPSALQLWLLLISPLGPQGLLRNPSPLLHPCSSTCHLAVAWAFVLLSPLPATPSLALEFVLHFLLLYFRRCLKVIVSGSPPLPSQPILTC